jgi:putative transposase
MPANENRNRVQGTLLQDGKHDVGARPARDQQGHHALRKGRVSIANGIYLITTTTFKRQKLFEDFPVGCAAARCFEDADVLGDAKMLAWVLMPDHAHWLLQLGERDDLSVVVNRLKSASARYTNRARSASGVVWAKSFHDHALRSEDDLQDVARYVVANPLRAGLVERLGDYPFWNAVWL